MARQKDELYDERYNTYMNQPIDMDIYKLEDRFNALESDLYTEEDEELILNEIVAISENRMARESHIKAHQYEMEYVNKLKNDQKLDEEELFWPFIGRKLDFNSLLYGIAVIAWVLIVTLFGMKASAQNLTVWCLVTDYNTQCIYYNLDSCQSNALESGGVCVPKQINEGE